MTERSIYRSPAGRREIQALYDGVLTRWPVPYRPLTLDTRHGSTFVLDCGPPDAAPVVLLHGANSNALAWMGEVEDLSRGFRVCAVDIPGEPGRSADHRLPLAGPAFVEWLEDVLSALGAPRMSLVGMSQGGFTALKFATAQPERVDRLVLLAPGGVAPVRTGFMLRAIPLSWCGRRGAEAVVRLTFGRRMVDETATRFMDLIMTNVRPRIEPQPLFTDAELGRLTMPVLLVQGARDAIVNTQRTAERLSGLLPDLHACLLPEEGHVLVGHGASIACFLAEGTAFDSRSLQPVA